MKTMDVTLVDAAGKHRNFSLSFSPKGLRSKPNWTERGFGTCQTDTAELDGLVISGDLWRFFDGTCGLEALLEIWHSESLNGPELVGEFATAFKATSDDNAAMDIWTKLTGKHAADQEGATCSA